MNTISFELSSGPIYCYNLDSVIRVHHDTHTRLSGTTKKSVYLEAKEDKKIKILYYEFKKEDEDSRKSYDPHDLDAGEHKFYDERLNDCILLLSKLLEVGFLDESGYNSFLKKFRDDLIHYYDWKTKKAEEKLKEKEDEIAEVQKRDIDNEKLESQIGDLLSEVNGENL